VWNLGHGTRKKTTVAEDVTPQTGPQGEEQWPYNEGGTKKTWGKRAGGGETKTEGVKGPPPVKKKKAQGLDGKEKKNGNGTPRKKPFAEILNERWWGPFGERIFVEQREGGGKFWVRTWGGKARINFVAVKCSLVEKREEENEHVVRKGKTQVHVALRVRGSRKGKKKSAGRTVEPRFFFFLKNKRLKKGEWGNRMKKKHFYEKSYGGADQEKGNGGKGVQRRSR